MKRTRSSPIVPRLPTFDWQLPHISRIFTARVPTWAEPVALWGISMALIVSFGASLQVIPSYNTYRLGVLSDPYDTLPYIRFAEILRAQGLQNEALGQITLAEDLASRKVRVPGLRNANVLGAVSSPFDVVRRWNTESRSSEDAYIHWSRIIEERPDYRDAYLLAAAAAYRSHRPDEAVALVNTALSIDPNNADARKLLSEITGK